MSEDARLSPQPKARPSHHLLKENGLQDKEGTGPDSNQEQYLEEVRRGRGDQVG